MSQDGWDGLNAIDIYDSNGQHVGVGKPRSDGLIDLYDVHGRRGLEMKPDKARRR